MSRRLRPSSPRPPGYPRSSSAGTTLRALVGDLGRLPERQRSALLLAALGGFDHGEIAEVVGCEVGQVKALVFQARTKLTEDRRARDIPCPEIREQLAAGSRAGRRRRGAVARHVRACAGCTDFATEVRRQQGMLALVLPVVPTASLRDSALAAIGAGGGGGTGGAALLAKAGAIKATVAKASAVCVLGPAQSRPEVWRPVRTRRTAARVEIPTPRARVW